MEKYTLHEVTSAAQAREFLELTERIYKDYPNWVRPLDNDIEAVFDPAKNRLFEDGEAIRWIARDDKGQTVGRIAAFYNRELAACNDQPTGGCGFFEAVDDSELARLLFDAARDWLASRGMEAMDGPVNFGPRDSWWGLLVDGFDHQPLYGNPYNPPYYQRLFEEYGFMNYFNQFTYRRELAAGLFSQSVYERVRRLEETPGYRFEHIDKRRLEQAAEEFRIIYNKAWALFTGVKPMEPEEAVQLMNTLKPIIDERLIYFAYHNDEPIGFFIMVPDLNRIIGKFHGRLTLWNKLRLMWELKVAHSVDRVSGLIFGVTPEYHGKGIEAGMMRAFEKMISEGKIGYTTLELAWIGDFNPVMMRMVENFVCASKHKMHTTYRYLFDRNKEFRRCPRLGIKRENRE